MLKRSRAHVKYARNHPHTRTRTLPRHSPSLPRPPCQCKTRVTHQVWMKAVPNPARARVCDQIIERMLHVHVKRYLPAHMYIRPVPIFHQNRRNWHMRTQYTYWKNRTNNAHRREQNVLRSGSPHALHCHILTPNEQAAALPSIFKVHATHVQRRRTGK